MRQGTGTQDRSLIEFDPSCDNEMDTTEGDRLRGGALALRLGDDAEGGRGQLSTSAESERRVRDDDMKVRRGEALYFDKWWWFSLICL